MKRTRPVLLAVVAALALDSFVTADAAWKWSGTFGDKAVELLILGDIQIHSRRADPTTAFHRMRDTLKKADLVSSADFRRVNRLLQA